MLWTENVGETECLEPVLEQNTDEVYENILQKSNLLTICSFFQKFFAVFTR